MNAKKNAVMLITSLILLGNCSKHSPTNDAANSIDTQIVLKIGKVNITGYEYDKALDAFKNTFFQKTGRKPRSADIKNWVNEFINHNYFWRMLMPKAMIKISILTV